MVVEPEVEGGPRGPRAGAAAGSRRAGSFTWLLALAAISAARPAAAQQAAATPGGTPRPAEVRADAARQEGKLSVVPFAMPGYQPETGFLLGAAGVLVHQPAAGSGRKESQLVLAGAASVRGQFSAALQPEWYLAGDDVQLTGMLGYSLFPDLFYGMGAATRAADEERYTPTYLELAATPAYRVARALYLGPTVRLQRATIGELAAGGRLAPGTITGSRGGTIVQLGATGSFDTRDSTLYPRSGALVRLQLLRSEPELGSDFTFSLARLDARGYVTPWGRAVLAAQVLVELRDGEPPFYDTGRLGGEVAMRGYFAGRYRDRQLATAQLEVRTPLFWRLGAVAFASAGDVARDPADLGRSVKAAGGVGLRLAPVPDVPVNVRLDLAYGDDAAFYLGVGEAF